MDRLLSYLIQGSQPVIPNGGVTLLRPSLFGQVGWSYIFGKTTIIMAMKPQNQFQSSTAAESNKPANQTSKSAGNKICLTSD